MFDQARRNCGRRFVLFGVFLCVFLLLFFLNVFIRRSLISWWQKQENNNTFSKEKKPLLCQHSQHFCADVRRRNLQTYATAYV